MNKSEYIKLNDSGIISVSVSQEEQEFWGMLKHYGIVNINYADNKIHHVTFSIQQKQMLKKIKETLIVLEQVVYNNESNFTSRRVYTILKNSGCSIQEMKTLNSERNQYILLENKRTAEQLYEDLEFLQYFQTETMNISQTIVGQQNIQTTKIENNSGTLRIEQNINNIDEVVQYVSEELQVLKNCNVDQSIVENFLECRDESSLKQVIENICLALGAGSSLVTLGPILMTLLSFFFKY